MKRIGIISALVILGIGIVVFATDILFLWIPFIGHTPEYGSKAAAFFMALTAFITLLLASATFQSTNQMNLREQERRVDSIEKETRDRKERYLNEIINWLNKVARCGFEEVVSIPVLPDAHNKEAFMTRTALDNLDMIGSRSRILIIDGKYINKLASYFSEYTPDLAAEVQKVIDNLTRVENEMCEHIKNFKELGMPDDANVRNLSNSAEILIDKFAAMKLSIIS